MIYPSGKQARKTLCAIGLAALSFLMPQRVCAALGGAEILTKTRELIRAQEVVLTGKLRTGAVNVPFQLTQHEGVSTYQFRDPAETISVALADSGVKISGLPPEKASSSLIRGSVLSYDDLTLRFLYWTRIEDLGQEKLRSLPCWKLRLDAPDKTSPYAFVKLWVNQQSNAFIRAQAFDWEGVLAKQFDVISTQTIAGSYYLKSMKIQLTRPLSSSGETLSYLEIDKPQ